VTLKDQGRGPDIFGCKYLEERSVRDMTGQTPCSLNIIMLTSLQIMVEKLHF